MKPRSRAAQPAHAPAGHGKGTGDRPIASSGRPAARRWMGIGLILLILVAAGFWSWQRRQGPPLPRLQTDALDATAAGVLQQHLADVRAAPRSGPAWGRLGALLRSLEFKPEARYCLEIAQRLDPTEARWPHSLGLLVMQEKPREAVVHFRRATELCGIVPEAPRLRLAKLLAETGEWTEMERVLQPLLRAEPGHGPALLALAQAAQARGELDAAVELATRSALDPRTAAGSWSLLAALYQRQGVPDKAHEATQQAASAPPDAPLTDPFETEVALTRGDPRQLSNRAQQLLVNRRLAEAAPLIQQLVREHRTFSEGWLLLGRLHLLQNQLAQAQLAIQQHLQLEPSSVQGWFQLGMVQLQQQRFTDAAATFREATRLKPDFGPAFYNLGVALLRAGSKSEAVAPFLEAIRHNPEYIDSYFLLADLYQQLGQKQEALAIARRAEELNPNDRRLPELKARLATP